MPASLLSSRVAHRLSWPTLLWGCALGCFIYVPWVTACCLLILAGYYAKTGRSTYHEGFSIQADRRIILTLSALIVVVGALHFTTSALLGAFNYVPYLLVLLILLYAPCVFKNVHQMVFGFIVAQIPYFLLVFYLAVLASPHSLGYAHFVHGDHKVFNPLFVNKNNVAIVAAAILLLSVNCLFQRGYGFFQKALLGLMVLLVSVDLALITSRNSIVSLCLALVIQFVLLVKAQRLNKFVYVGLAVLMVVIGGVGFSILKARYVIAWRQSTQSHLLVLQKNKQLAVQQMIKKAHLQSKQNSQPVTSVLNAMAKAQGFRSFNAFKQYRVGLVSPNQQVRLYIWHYALNHIFDHPLIGHGWQSFGPNYLSSAIYKRGVFLSEFYKDGFASQVHHPHQLYLTWLYEGGWLVFVCYLALLFMVLRRGWLSPWRDIFLSPLCLLLISGLFDNLFYDPRVNILFIFLVAWNYGSRYLFPSRDVGDLS